MVSSGLPQLLSSLFIKHMSNQGGRYCISSYQIDINDNDYRWYLRNIWLMEWKDIILTSASINFPVVSRTIMKSKKTIVHLLVSSQIDINNDRHRCYLRNSWKGRYYVFRCVSTIFTVVFNKRSSNWRDRHTKDYKFPSWLHLLTYISSSQIVRTFSFVFLHY